MSKSTGRNQAKMKSCEIDEQHNSKLFLQSKWSSCVRSATILKRVTVVMRSAERVDRIFGTSWPVNETFMNKVYPTDINVPRDVGRHPQSYHLNPPITNIGKYSTKLVARALLNRGIEPKVIYCSPTLRTVQTAVAIAASINGARICIEPGLLEPVEWYREAGAVQLPDFGGELVSNYCFDEEYKSIFSIGEIRETFSTKTQDQCIQRIQLVVQNICGVQHESPALIVAHAITMAIVRRFAEVGNRLEADDVDEYTSYEAFDYVAEPCAQSARLELGVKFPPGSVIGILRMNDSPPSVLRTIPDIIPPFTIGKFSNVALQ